MRRATAEPLASLAHHDAASVSRCPNCVGARRAWHCFPAPRRISTAHLAVTPPAAARAALRSFDAYSPWARAQMLALAWTAFPWGSSPSASSAPVAAKRATSSRARAEIPSAALSNQPPVPQPGLRIPACTASQCRTSGVPAPGHTATDNTALYPPKRRSIHPAQRTSTRPRRTRDPKTRNARISSCLGDLPESPASSRGVWLRQPIYHLALRTTPQK